MRTKNFPAKQDERRRSALERLTAQLSSGMKHTRDGDVPLTESDKRRINNEISTLKRRLDSDAINRRTKKHR